MELVKLMNMSNYQVNSRVRDSSATPSIQITGAGANRPSAPTTPATDSGCKADPCRVNEGDCSGQCCTQIEFCQS